MKKLLALLAVCLTMTPPYAAAAEIVEGIEFLRLTYPQPVETGAKIEVREFFWYGCPHCYVLEPHLEKWLRNKPKNAAFVRTPGVIIDPSTGALDERWAVHARAYYAFEALRLTDKLHRKLFDAIHLQGRRLDSPQQLAEFVQANGGNAKTFLDTLNSFGVQNSVSRSQRLAQTMGIRSVPTLVIDGKFVTNVQFAGGDEKIPAVLDFLVRQAAAERAKK